MKTINRFSVIMTALVMVLVAGCSFQDEEKAPEAQLPVIMSITPNVTTVLNIEKELTVTAQVEDQGTLSYQWYVSESMLSKGSAVENANKQSYMPPVTKVGTSYYYCVISNKLADSTRSVISPIITYIVNENISAKAPVIIEQPVSQALEMGKNFVLNVAAYSPDNGTLSYQWYFASQEDEEGTAIENATESSYEGSVTKNTVGYYWCVVTSEISDNGDGGLKSADTESSKIQIKTSIVNAANPLILKQPEDVLLNFNEKFTLTVIAYSSDNGKLTYQWYKGNQLLAGATESTYKGTISSESLGEYYCEVTSTITDNEDGGIKSAKAKSESAVIEAAAINAQKPVIQQMPVNVSAEYGIVFSLSVTAHAVDGGTLTYQWFKDNEKIEGAINSSYRSTVSSKTLGEYYCEVTNTIADNGDGGVKTAKETTTSAIISKNNVNANAPVIVQNPADLSAVVGKSFTFTVAAYSVDKGTLTYQWYKDDKKIDGATESSYTAVTSAASVGSYYCKVTNSITDNGDGGKKTSSIETKKKNLSLIKIDAKKPVILMQPESVATAFGNDFLFTVIADSPDEGTLTYQWYKISDEDDDEVLIPQATANKYAGVMSANAAGSYYCIVTNIMEDNGDGGKKSESVTTATVTLAKNMLNALTPVITTQPVDSMVSVPGVKVLSVGACTFDDGTLSYQWYTVEEGEEEGVAIECATQERYKVCANDQGKNGYYCIVTNTLADNGDGGNKTASVKSSTAWVNAVYDGDSISAPDFTVQPVSMNIAPYNQSIELSCTAEAAEGTVFYRWYQSTDGTTNTGTPITSANTAKFESPVYTEKGIYYYYCVATTVVDDIQSAANFSDVVSVAYTGLPLVVVDTPNKVAITSKEDWVKKSTISIRGAKDSSWNFENVKTSIRGRGNTTWSKPKKPYALKLDDKQKIMGMPKHKRWVLIANYLDNSFMRNEIAFYLSEQLGMDYTVHGEFCDLILNGEYKGLYWLGEAIKPDKNRVNINDGSDDMTDDQDKDYLIEMDVYYDEIVKFKSSIRKMPYMIKNDDYMIDDNDNVSTGGQARLERLQAKINALEQLLYPDYIEGMNTNNCSAPNEDYSSIIDVNSWAKFWLVNEIMNNSELGHPKSCYFTFDSKNNIMKAGPVWDFDWASWNTSNSGKIYLKSTIYFNALFKSSKFNTAVKSIWKENNINIDINSKIEEMRELINLAAEYDARLWEVNHNPNNTVFTDFDEHVNFIKDILLQKYNVVTNEINTF